TSQDLELGRVLPRRRRVRHHCPRPARRIDRVASIGGGGGVMGLLPIRRCRHCRSTRGFSGVAREEEVFRARGPGAHAAPPKIVLRRRAWASLSGGAEAASRSAAASTSSKVAGLTETASASRSVRSTLTREPTLTAGSRPSAMYFRRVEYAA